MPCTLRVEFATEEAFRREYTDNISKGGIFVATRTPPAMQEAVSVALVLPGAREPITLPGEVVHCIPPEFAETGAQPGVAIQFQLEAAEVRKRLAAFAPAESDSFSEQASGAGRRAARRSRLRVLVQVQVDGKWGDGRTRNISSSGVLITLAGDPLPVGQSVRVSLTHPTGEDEIEVDGRVRRHVEGAGETCMGIEFLIPETQREEFDGFLERLRATEHHRRLGGINGPIADLGFERLLRMFGGTAPEGTLTLSRGDEEGSIAIDHGSLRAKVGKLTGRDALDILSGWQDGIFEFEARIESGFVSGPAVSLAAFFGEADPEPAPPDAAEVELELLDIVEPEPSSPFGPEDADAISAGKLSADMDPLADTATLVLTDRARDPAHASILDESSKTEQALLDLAGVGVTVGKAVEIIPEPAADVHAALTGLIANGLIAVH